MPNEPRCKKVCSYALPIDDVDYYKYANIRRWWQHAAAEFWLSPSQVAKREAEWEAERAAERKRDDALRRKKIAAQGAVQAAARAGRLHRGPCEVCGTTQDICGHHDDYDKPLEVRWLCREHHADLHGWTPEDSAMSKVERAMDKLVKAGDNPSHPSEELADLQRQLSRFWHDKLQVAFSELGA